MLLIKKILNRFSKQVPSDYEFAFECNGVNYYNFVNEQKIPIMRFFKALDIYEELNYGMTTEHLKVFFETLEAGFTVTKKGIDLSKILYLIHEAKNRLNHCNNIEILYRLASVIYFPLSENVTDFDYEISEKKIKEWKKNNSIQGFFLNKPIGKYLPSLNGANTSLEVMQKAQIAELKKILAVQLSILSENGKDNDLYKSCNLLMEKLQIMSE